MTVRSGPGEPTPRAGITAEVIEMWKQLTGRASTPFARRSAMLGWAIVFTAMVPQLL